MGLRLRLKNAKTAQDTRLDQITEKEESKSRTRLSNLNIADTFSRNPEEEAAKKKPWIL